MKAYSTYLFDFDGTTFDTRDSLVPVFRTLLGAVGIYDVTEEDCHHYMHQSLAETFEEAGIPKEKWQYAIDVCNTCINEPEILAKNVPFPESAKVLQALFDRGSKIGYVSGNTKNHIDLVLKTQQFPEVHSVIMGSDIYKRHKPHPEPILLACQELGVPTDSSVLYVGDSLQDAECAKAAGVDYVLIDREGELSDYPGWKIVSLEELL